MIPRLTTVHENARSALECGGLTPPSRLGPHPGGAPRRRQAAALQGAFGTAIFVPARNPALIVAFRYTQAQSEIPRFARNDMKLHSPTE